MKNIEMVKEQPQPGAYDTSKYRIKRMSGNEQPDYYIVQKRVFLLGWVDFIYTPRETMPTLDEGIIEVYPKRPVPFASYREAEDALLRRLKGGYILSKEVDIFGNIKGYSVSDK